MPLPRDWITRQPPRPAHVATGKESLPASRCLDIHRLMVRTRAMEELMIRMSKSGESLFWVGGAGEEAFNVCLGLQIKKGCGPDFDYLHFHYRNGATMVAMGMPLVDGIRQGVMTLTDPFSQGRNFSSHYSRREWNVLPVTSPVGTQCSIGIGTAWVQKRRGGDGITVVTCGDASTAESDFSTFLIWSTRPGNELPMLMAVTNNGWGISTPAHTQHAERRIVDRGEAFGIASEVVDGNDPIASWHAIDRAMAYCRRQRHPFLLEAQVSRLYGHSSSSGTARVDEPDCIPLFEQKLLSVGVISAEAIEQVHADAQAEAEAALDQAREEPAPTPADISRHTYAPSPVDAVYPEDFDGLPG